MTQKYTHIYVTVDTSWPADVKEHQDRLNKFIDNTTVFNVVDWKQLREFILTSDVEHTVDQPFPYPVEMHVGTAAITAIYEKAGKLSLRVCARLNGVYTKEQLKCMQFNMDAMLIKDTKSEHWFLYGFKVRSGEEFDSTSQDLVIDPFVDYLDMPRNRTALGNQSDDELANTVYMYGNSQLDERTLKAILAGLQPSAIIALTAAKERIRWLSRKLLEEKFNNFKP